MLSRFAFARQWVCVYGEQVSLLRAGSSLLCRERAEKSREGGRVIGNQVNESRRYQGPIEIVFIAISDLGRSQCQKRVFRSHSTSPLRAICSVACGRLTVSFFTPMFPTKHSKVVGKEIPPNVALYHDVGGCGLRKTRSQRTRAFRLPIVYSNSLVDLCVQSHPRLSFA
jgi:hypothetical protein